MAITSETLQTPERGMELETREKRTPKKRMTAADLREEVEGLQEELQTIKQRTAEARDLALPKGDLTCFDCYRKGLIAAVDHIEGKVPKQGNPDRDRP